MIYVKREEFARYLVHNNLEVVDSIDATGSIRGMNKRFGWNKYEKIRSGKYIYAVRKRG